MKILKDFWMWYLENGMDNPRQIPMLLGVYILAGAGVIFLFKDEFVERAIVWFGTTFVVALLLFLRFLVQRRRG